MDVKIGEKVVQIKSDKVFENLHEKRFIKGMKSG